MPKDIQELVYDELVRILNLNTQELSFNGGWNVVFWDGKPYVIDKSSNSYFDYTRKEVIAVAEQYSTESPSVNESDSAGFTAMYEIVFRLEYLDKVKQALIEYRTYMLANKKISLNDYQITFKTSRGEKIPTITADGGSFWGRYNLKVYYDTTRYGYLYDTVANTWKIKLDGDVDYTTLKLAQDNFSSQGNPQFSNATAVAKGDIDSKSSNTALNVLYENNDDGENVVNNLMSRHLYSVVMNKVDKDQIYDLQHILDGQVFNYRAKIASGSRTLLPNGRIVMTLNWLEADE